MAGNSKSVKKSEQTKKDKYGEDFHAKAGASGGRVHSRGYFGKLKDEGRLGELRDLATKGVTKTNEIKAAKRNESPTRKRSKKSKVRVPRRSS